MTKIEKAADDACNEFFRTGVASKMLMEKLAYALLVPESDDEPVSIASDFETVDEPIFENGDPMNLAAAAHIARRYLARHAKTPETTERVVRLLNQFLPIDETLPK